MYLLCEIKFLWIEKTHGATITIHRICKTLEKHYNQFLSCGTHFNIDIQILILRNLND